MSQFYSVPNIYTDMSDQYQGYFRFRFTCQQCFWHIDTAPIRSKVSTTTNVMDIGIGMLNGFWGRAAEMGEKVYGSRWHQEQAEALQKSWTEIQSHFHHCPKCFRTVCQRCFNGQLNLCVSCAPDLRADGAQHLHQLNVDAQRQQVDQHYEAPRFNVDQIPSVVSPDMVKGPLQRPNTPEMMTCPSCHQLGPGGKFCQHCGIKLPVAPRICPGCSSEIGGGAKFCQECGTRL